MKVLLTGASGFVGRWVQSQLGQEQAVAFPDTLDLREQTAVKAFVAKSTYDAVLHLAAISSVKKSYDRPQEVFDVNVLGTRNLLQSLAEVGFSGRVLLVSSGEVYGSVDASQIPVKESRPLAPISPYAKSKVEMEALVGPSGEFHSCSFQSFIARPFNHTGPGQASDFFIGSMVDQIAKRASGKTHGPLLVGNLQVTRDFTDVRDVVRAYLAILTASRLDHPVYNVGSGTEVSLEVVVQKLLQIAKMRNADLDVVPQVDPERLRTTDQTRMCADVSRIQEATGWRPNVSLDQTLSDALTFRLNELSSAKEFQ